MRRSASASSGDAIHFVEANSAVDVAAPWLLSIHKTLQDPLAEHGIRTTHSSSLVAGAINLATAAWLSHLWRPYYRSFVVGLRCDSVELSQCDWEIVAAGLAGPRVGRTVMAPWTSAAVLSRDAERQDQVAQLAFVSLSAAQSRWREATTQITALAALGVTCRFKSEPLVDMTDIDVLVVDCAELRQPGRAFVSPIIAAWRAGVPAILIDSAFERANRRDALDYLPISTAGELAQTVAQLQSHPQLYSAMRQHGADRARELRDTALTKRWVETFTDHIMPLARTVLPQQRANPIDALSRQTGRWLAQQGQRFTQHPTREPAR